MIPARELMSRDTRRFCFWLPKRCCWTAAMTALSLAAVTVLVVLPIQQKLLAIRVIEQAGGSVDSEFRGPTWLRSLIGNLAVAESVFSEVRAVSVAGTEFSDSEMAQLQSFRNLDKVDLDSTRVTDAGLLFLEGQSSLTVLDLSGLRITDPGIASLTTLKSLRILDLDGTGVSDTGVAELKRALPGVRVQR